jgi:hypothetical protein
MSAVTYAGAVRTYLFIQSAVVKKNAILELERRATPDQLRRRRIPLLVRPVEAQNIMRERDVRLRSSAEPRPQTRNTAAHLLK